MTDMKVLVFGDGWIGNKLAQRFGTKPVSTDILDLRMAKIAIRLVKPDWVINAAGKCGSPNIDWCEASDINKKLTLYSNAYGPAILEEATRFYDCKFLHLSSGCVWESGEEKVETDFPSPNSYYAETKVKGEQGLHYDSTLILRLRMPFDGTLSDRNLITKLARYPFVLNVPNSMTCMNDLLDAVEFLMNKDESGVFHVANQGSMSGVDVMTLYQQIVNPEHQFTPITMQELKDRGLVTTGRSNVTLCCDKLAQTGFKMPSAIHSMIRCLHSYAAALKAK